MPGRPHGADPDFHQLKTDLEIVKVTLAHVSRAVDDVREHIARGMASKEQVDHIDERLKTVESTQTWVMRTVVAIVIASVMAIAYKGGLK